MGAKIVLGLGFGDEGKGITTDFLCTKAEGSTIVVRFSGGQQAGHTVQIGDKRHVYATFGSGTGRGIRTYISEYCTFYPPNALNEYNELLEKHYFPSLYIHPFTKLTSYWDVAWNRMMETANNHGSCGIGVGATMTRQEQSPYKLHVIDLTNEVVLREKLSAIGRYYGDKVKDLKDSMYMGIFSIELDKEKKRFKDALGSGFIRNLVTMKIRSYDYLRMFKNVIFEGSQGILLDMEHGVFPNVTYSSTTSKNALQICRKLGLVMEEVDIYYVTRTYLTRHGNGWFPDKPVELINNEQETNVFNEWQRSFKTSELDYSLLNYSLGVDEAYSYDCNHHLVVTCRDQMKSEFNYVWAQDFDSIHESWSPDSKDFKKIF